MSKGLQAIQEAFAAQRMRDLEARRRSNNVMLIVAGSLAAAGFLTMLLLALKPALPVGVIFAGLVALLLYLVYAQHAGY